MNSQTEHPAAGAPDPAGAPSAEEPRRPPASAQADQPDEAQLRAAYEAELSRISSVDMALQSAASLLNIGAYRLGLTGPPAAQAPAQADLEQVRDAIDAVRGLLPVIERSAPTELRPLRDALAQLQMAYSRAVQAVPVPPAPPQEQAAPGAAPPASSTPPAPPAPVPAAGGPAQTGTEGGEPGPGPAESSGRLWVPGR